MNSPSSLTSSTIALPSSDGDVLPCPLCHSTGNRLVISEAGIERRFGMPVLPVTDYFQACCGNCGLLYINAVVDQDYLNRLYSNETVEWATELLGDPDARMNDDERARFAEVVGLVAKFKSLRGADWLDFGCQTGELGEIAIRQHGANLSGVEISDDYAERAARLWDREREVVKSDLSGHGEQKFDVISSLETLEHMAKPWEMVAAFRRHLKLGGLLVVSVPSSHYFRLKYHVFRLARWLTDQKLLRQRKESDRASIFGLCHTHLYNFTPQSLSLLMVQQGLEPVDVRGIGWLSRYWIFEKFARFIELLTFRRIAIFPSVIVVARARAN